MASSGHIFIVDDDLTIRTLAARALAGADREIHQFATAAEVESALTLWAPILIILDLSLSDSDGIEVIHSLARARFIGNVLLLSGHDEATLDDVRSIGLAHGLRMLPALR